MIRTVNKKVIIVIISVIICLVIAVVVLIRCSKNASDEYDASIEVSVSDGSRVLIPESSEFSGVTYDSDMTAESVSITDDGNRESNNTSVSVVDNSQEVLEMENMPSGTSATISTSDSYIDHENELPILEE